MEIYILYIYIYIYIYVKGDMHEDVKEMRIFDILVSDNLGRKF